MEDPLRHKQLSSETVLWFEFLLDPTLLTDHLYKVCLEPPRAWKPPIKNYKLDGTLNYYSFLFLHSISTPNTGPSPIELINQFLSISPETQANQDVNNPTPEIFEPQDSFNKIGRKQLALKILGLKVASYLKWNLGTSNRCIGNTNNDNFCLYCRDF